MVLSKERIGLFSILLSLFLWASFPVLSTLGFKSLPVFTSAALTVLCSTVFFLCVLAFDPPRKWPSPTCIRQIAFACISIGIVYYTLTYIGISLTTPGNAAIVMLMEIFFSYLFISVIGKHEPLVKSHVVGACLMVGGVLCVLLPSARALRLGDFILLVASMVPPLGNIAMQQARKEVSAATIMFFRSLAGAVCLGLLAYFFEGVPSSQSLFSGLPVILIGGFLLMGFSKILWIEAIHRLPITQTISIASISPLLTMGFAFVILGQRPEWVQLLSLPPIAIGMYLLTLKPSLAVEGLEEI